MQYFYNNRLRIIVWFKLIYDIPSNKTNNILLLVSKYQISWRLRFCPYERFCLNSLFNEVTWICLSHTISDVILLSEVPQNTDIASMSFNVKALYWNYVIKHIFISRCLRNKTLVYNIPKSKLNVDSIHSRIWRSDSVLKEWK